MESIDLKGGPDRPAMSFWTSRAFLIFLTFGAMATVLLWSEHRAHLLGLLFLLACPLLHIFGGHGSHSAHSRTTSEGDQP